MSDYDIVPTEAVHPHGLRRGRPESDFFANRPRMSEKSDDSFGGPMGRSGGAKGLLDMVPEEFRDQFRAFDEDTFFRDSVPAGGRRWSAGSSRASVPAQVGAQAPLIHAAPAQAAPAQAAPRRPGFFRRLVSGIGSGLGRAAGWVSNALSGLFGRRRSGAAVPQAAPVPRAEPAFDYDDADMQRMLPGIPRTRQQVDVSRLNPMVPGMAPDTRVAPKDDPYDIVAQAEREQAAAVAAMQAHMAKQVALPRAAKGPAVAAAHGSSQTDLDAAFDNMQDDEEAEDLLIDSRAQAPTKTDAASAVAAPAPPKKERSRESFLREGDAMWNSMQDDDEDAGDVREVQPRAMTEAHASEPFNDERLSIDVEQEGGLEEDLQNIPADMRDFPGAEILYEPQRVRMKER